MNGGIYIVSDKETGKAYIEKVATADEVQRQTVELEIDILEQLKRHDFIVQIADCWLDKKLLRGGIILEYCTKGSLETLIEKHRKENNRPISEQWIWRWSMQLSSALAYCHYGPTYNEADTSWDYIVHRGKSLEVRNCAITVDVSHT
jgi:serine/threonine protein kinase